MRPPLWLCWVLSLGAGVAAWMSAAAGGVSYGLGAATLILTMAVLSR